MVINLLIVRIYKLIFNESKIAYINILYVLNSYLIYLKTVCTVRSVLASA